MLTFEFTLGPLRIYFNLGDAAEAVTPDVEYVPAAQVERADQPLTDLAPDQYEGRIGFHAR